MGLLVGIIILDTPLDTDLILCLLISLSISRRFDGSEYPISLVESDLAIFDLFFFLIIYLLMINKLDTLLNEGRLMKRRTSVYD